MADERDKLGNPPKGPSQNDGMEKLSADQMRQSRIVRKSPGQRRLVIGIIIVGIIGLAVVVMNVAP